MAWIAANKDGSIVIGKNKPIRFYSCDKNYAMEYPYDVFSISDMEKENIWIMDVSKNDDGSFRSKKELPYGLTNELYCGLLTKENVEKLIGRKLTWEDEPVEI